MRANGEHARWEAELIGGPADGTRLFLDVVQVGADKIRVVEQEYTRTFRPLMASEITSETEP